MYAGTQRQRDTVFLNENQLLDPESGSVYRAVNIIWEYYQELVRLYGGINLIAKGWMGWRGGEDWRTINFYETKEPI